jgi:DNA-binding response OmpR family regulator
MVTGPAVFRRSTRVLVVDEERDARDHLCDLLHGEGYDVVPIATGRRAMLLPSKEPPPSLLIVAQEMAEYAGSDILAEIERSPNWADVPVILLTAAHDSLLALALETAGQAVVPKPVNGPELMARVRRLVPDRRATVSRGR